MEWEVWKNKNKANIFYLTFLEEKALQLQGNKDIAIVRGNGQKNRRTESRIQIDLR